MLAPRSLVTLLLACCALACPLLGAAATAGAEESARVAGLPATVSFVEDGPLTLDSAAVNALLEAEAGLAVRVHNELPRAQRITVELSGLADAGDPGIARIFPSSHSTLLLGPGQSRTFAIALGEPGIKPADETFEGVLLAYGSRGGGIARRPVTVEYRSGAALQEKENALSPKRPIDITMRAVNYLPSPLSDLYSFFFFLAGALVVGALLFREQIARRIEQLPRLLAALGVLIAIVAAVGALETGWGQPGLNLIASRPVELAPSVAAGNRGTAIAEDGSLAQLVASGPAANRELKARGLASAGEYKGKYDLGEQAEAAAVVNLRDYWLWAVAAIALGLLGGIWMRRWFQERRPSAELRSRLDRLMHNYRADREAVGPEALSIESRVSARQQELEDLLKTGDTTAATEKLAALSTYLDRFYSLCEKRANLATAIARLQGVPDIDRLGFDLADARLLAEARELVGAAVDGPGLDSDEAELKKEDETTVAMTALVARATRQLRLSVRHLLAVDSLQPGVTEPQARQDLAEIEAELRTAGQEALQANSEADLESAETADDKALRRLRQLGSQVVAPGGREVRKVALAADLRGFAAGGNGDEAALAEMVFEEPRSARPPTDVTISWELLTDDGPGEGGLRVEDRVRFAVELKGATEIEQVMIAFGDGTHAIRRVPAPDTLLHASHTYRGTDATEVVVSALPGGAVLKRKRLPEIHPDPRPLPSERDLAATDGAVNRAAFVLAVASGLGVLYFANSSWGEPVDYLAAFVWGGVTGEGVKYAAAIADRVWPGG